MSVHMNHHLCILYNRLMHVIKIEMVRYRPYMCVFNDVNGESIFVVVDNRKIHFVKIYGSMAIS